MDSAGKQRSVAEIFQGFKEGERELRDILRGFPRTSEDLEYELNRIQLRFEQAENVFHREGISEFPAPSSRSEASSYLGRYWPAPPNLWILILTVGLLFFGSITFMTMALNIPKRLETRTTNDEIGVLKIDEISELFGQSLLLTIVLVFVLFFIYTPMYWMVWGFLFLFFFGPRKLVRGWLKEPERQMVPDPERLPAIYNDQNLNSLDQPMDIPLDNDQHLDPLKIDDEPLGVLLNNDQHLNPQNNHDGQGARL
jgi:hypothetical protein